MKIRAYSELRSEESEREKQKLVYSSEEWSERTRAPSASSEKENHEKSSLFPRGLPLARARGVIKRKKENKKAG